MTTELPHLHVLVTCTYGRKRWAERKRQIELTKKIWFTPLLCPPDEMWTCRKSPCTRRTQPSALTNGVMTFNLLPSNGEVSYNVLLSGQLVYRIFTLRTCQPWGWMLHCTDIDIPIMVQTLCRYCSVGGTAGETSCLGTGVAGGIRHLLALSSVSQSIVSSDPGEEAASSFGWMEEERARSWFSNV